MVLPPEYQWQFNSTDIIGNEKTNISINDYAKQLAQPWAQLQFNAATDIVSIGVASQEGDNETQEKLASRRGKSLYNKAIIPAIGLASATTNGT